MGNRRTNMKKLLIVIAFFMVLLAVNTRATMYIGGISTAPPSCSTENVQSAVTSAAIGDTILVPSGSCTWNGRLNIKRAIRLVGDNTQITLANVATTPLLTSDWNDDCGLNLEYSGGCPVFYKSSGGTRTLYYEGGFNYASPPANLTSSTPPWVTVTSRDMSVYVRIE